jgi:hypothetical protein
LLLLILSDKSGYLFNPVTLKIAVADFTEQPIQTVFISILGIIKHDDIKQTRNVGPPLLYLKYASPGQ